MSKQMKHGFKKQAAVLLIASLLAGMFPVFVTLPARAAEHCPVSNPRIDSDGVTTWDCIWFGNYWQGDTNGDGKADKSDKKTPIKWRVLSVEGDSLKFKKGELPADADATAGADADAAAAEAGQGQEQQAEPEA